MNIDRLPSDAVRSPGSVIHEYTKTDLVLTVDVKLHQVTNQAYDEVTKAYHSLMRALANNTCDFDTVETSIHNVHRHHMTNPGPF